ncbi:hypothetical protein OSTOST_18665 [Ostertagia ostertagi]
MSAARCRVHGSHWPNRRGRAERTERALAAARRRGDDAGDILKCHRLNDDYGGHMALDQSMPYIPSVSSAAAANMSSVANMTAAYFNSKSAAYGAPHLGFPTAPTHNFLPTGMGYIGGSLADCQQAGLAWNAGGPPRCGSKIAEQKLASRRKSQQNSSGGSSGSSSTEGTNSTTDADVNIKSEEPGESTLTDQSQSPCPDEKATPASYLSSSASPNNYAAASFRPQAQYTYANYQSPMDYFQYTQPSAGTTTNPYGMETWKFQPMG